MQSNLKFSLSIAAFFLLAAAPAVHADVVFTNVDSTACSCGIPIAGANSPTGQGAYSVAEAFTPLANYSLSDAQARLAGALGGTVDFALYSDLSDVPAVSLATLGSVTLQATDEGVYTANTLSHPVLLLANTQYWLVLTPGTSSTFVGWEIYGSSFQPSAVSRDPSGNTGWSNSGTDYLQFQIDGNPVTLSSAPEPTTAWLALAALGILGAARYRSK